MFLDSLSSGSQCGINFLKTQENIKVLKQKEKKITSAVH